MISFTSLLAGKPFRMVKSLMFMFLDTVSVMNEKNKMSSEPPGYRACTWSFNLCVLLNLMTWISWSADFSSLDVRGSRQHRHSSALVYHGFVTIGLLFNPNVILNDGVSLSARNSTHMMWDFVLNSWTFHVTTILLLISKKKSVPCHVNLCFVVHVLCGKYALFLFFVFFSVTMFFHFVYCFFLLISKHSA